LADGSGTVDNALASSPRYLTPMIFALLALLLGIVSITWLSAKHQSDADLLVRHSFEVERHITQAFSSLQDAETGQRGYLLTGEAAYLAPYTEAVPQIGREIDTLARLTGDNARQQERVAVLREAAKAKLAELAETVAKARAGDRRTALSIVDSDVGKAEMDRFRRTAAAMAAEEARLLAQRQQELAGAQTRTKLIILAAVVAIFLLGATIYLSISRVAGVLTAKNAALTDEINTRRNLQAQLVQSQKMEAIGQLTGGVAHDFNNMLAIVMGALNLLQLRLAKGDTNVGQLIDAALEGSRRAASLTNRLLAFSRQQPLKPEAIDANRMVTAMSELLRRTLGEQIDLQTVLAGGLWPAIADASQLENSILNLAVNARDAMPDGGKITIETANCHLDDAYAAGNHGVTPGQYVLIAVSDTGPGMTPEVREKAFDPFFTTKPTGKGTGLGLSQVYGFIKQSNGHVKIYSEPGNGTVVKMYVPRSFVEAQAAQTREAAETPRAADPSMVILVVEDDDNVRLVTTSSLRELGYTVIHAGRPTEALRMLIDAPRIDLLFTDVVMPEMNGGKLAAQARQVRPDLRVVFTTGYTRNSIVHNGVLDPDVDLLMKPFSVDQLASKIAKALEK
jgi:signal transduction histidine kinase/ActR/RegA family two-component response regulator